MPKKQFIIQALREQAGDEAKDLSDESLYRAFRENGGPAADDEGSSSTLMNYADSLNRGFMMGENRPGASFMERRVHDVGNYAAPAMGGAFGALAGPEGVPVGAMAGRSVQHALAQLMAETNAKVYPGSERIAPELDPLSTDFRKNPALDTMLTGIGEKGAQIAAPYVGQAWNSVKDNVKRFGVSMGSRFTGKSPQLLRTFMEDPVGSYAASGTNYRRGYVDAITPESNPVAVQSAQSKLAAVRGTPAEEEAAFALARAEKPQPLKQVTESIASQTGNTAPSVEQFKLAVDRGYEGLQKGDLSLQEALDAIQAMGEVGRRETLTPSQIRFYEKLKGELVSYMADNGVPRIGEAMSLYGKGVAGSAMRNLLPDDATAKTAAMLASGVSGVMGLSSRNPAKAAGMFVGTMAGSSPLVWGGGTLAAHGATRLAEFLGRNAAPIAAQKAVRAVTPRTDGSIKFDGLFVKDAKGLTKFVGRNSAENRLLNQVSLPVQNNPVEDEGINLEDRSNWNR